MIYKTICLQMLQDRPQLYDHLLSNRILLPTLNRLAGDLEALHQTAKERLAQARPGSSDSQIASEAREIAVQELADSLPPTFPPDEDEPFSLDAAMGYLRRHTPPA